MSENQIEFSTIGSETLRTSAPYQEVFDHARAIMIAHGANIKKEDSASGIIEGAWRYGINPFGLRVTVQFRTITELEIELNVKGGFADALDTTGAGKKKALEIVSLLKGIDPSSSIAMPPRLGDDQIQNRGKKKSVAGIMAFLLGGVGAHKFYLGNWGLGMVYLASLLIVPYISAVIGLIEAIRLFTMSENDFNEKYNYKNVQPFEVIW